MRPQQAKLLLVMVQADYDAMDQVISTLARSVCDIANSGDRVHIHIEETGFDIVPVVYEDDEP